MCSSPAAFAACSRLPTSTRLCLPASQARGAVGRSGCLWLLSPIPRHPSQAGGRGHLSRARAMAR